MKPNHVNWPIFPEENGYEQVQGFLINESRWGDPNLGLWWDKLRDLANDDLKPFGYRLEGTFHPPSPNDYKLYHHEKVVLDGIATFYPVSLNSLKSDFMLTVMDANQKPYLIRNQSVQVWKNISLWIHATPPQFLGDDIMYADMEQTNNQGITNISVYRNNRRIYTNPYLVEGQSIRSPLVDFWTYDEHWALYFFEKAGKVNLSYDSEEILLDGAIVPHGNCCSGSELNPRQVGNLLIFFMNKNQQWYYVEIEAESTQ